MTISPGVDANVAISFVVNGQPAFLSVPPRTHLADALRDQLGLTGTHLACEQGVCGACTVLIDGKTQRSCLALAADCDGAEITTIEGFDDDPSMAELRDSFSMHHGLQCGFCTPGMLITGRDIMLRLGDVPVARIREELAGNLCRCTGYVGIVEAIAASSAGKAPQPAIAEPIKAQAMASATASVSIAVPISMDKPTRSPSDAIPVPPPRTGGPGIQEHIVLAADPDIVWKALKDIRLVASCIPGAEITEIIGDHVSGRMRIALGPIKVAFAGEGAMQIDDETRTGKMSGRGRDSGTGSGASGEVAWHVIPSDDGMGSLVVVDLTWRLTGALAQFNRAGMVRDIVRRIASVFAANLEARLGSPDAASINVDLQSLGLFRLLWSVIKARFRPIKRNSK